MKKEDNLETIAAYAPPKIDRSLNESYYPRGLIALTCMVASGILYQQNEPLITLPWFFGHLEEYVVFERYLRAGCSLVSLGIGFFVEKEFLWKKTV